MSFTFLIVIVGDVREKLEQHASLMKESVSSIGGKTVDVHYVPYDTHEIMAYLISSCDSNKANCIVIIGDSTIPIDIKIISSTSKTIYEDIYETTFKKLSSVISELNKRLQIMIPQAVCGIRNKTLILNMFGQCLNATMCLKVNESIIFYVFDSIQTAQRERENAINSNKSLVGDTSNTHNKMIKIKNIIEIYKRHSHALISTLEAEEKISETVIQNNEIVEFECVSVHDAYGRILYEDVYSICNVPPFRTSAKNGYAINTNDGINVKNVLQEETSSIEPGTCVLVQNNSFIPNGATAVVQFKDTKKILEEYKNNIDDIEEEKEEIEIIIQPKEEENIRPIGYEVRKGEYILDKYTRIGLTEIGILTYCGVSKVIVIKQKLIGVLSIGDELEEPGEILTLKHDYDSSRLILMTLLKQQDFDSLDFGIANDNMESIISKIETALEKVDILVTIGSANDRDLLKPILQGYFNATIHFGGVNMSPGKSTTFATCTFNDTKKYFLCFSKNPATVPIVTHLFLLPLLNYLRCFEKSSPLVQARVQTSPIFHSRPKYIWTSLKWNNKDQYARIYDTANYYNHNANALLKLPPRTIEESKLPDAFITAVFCGST